MAEVVRSLQAEIVLNDRASPSLKMVDKNMSLVKRSLQGYRNMLKQAGKEGGIGSMLSNMATTHAAEQTLSKMKAISDEAINAAAGLEKMRTEFGVILGNKRDAEALVETLEGMAVSGKSFFNTDQLGAASKQLILAGATVQEQVPILKQLGDISAISGASLDELADAYAKSMTRGKVTSRELLTMTKNNIPIVETLADVLGASREDIMAMADEGLIGFADLQDALKGMTDAGGKFYQGQKKMMGTWTGMMKLLVTLREQILEAFGVTFTEIAKPFVEVLIVVGKWLLKLLENVNVVKAGLVAFGVVFTLLSAVMVASAIAMMAPALALLATIWPIVLIIGAVVGAIIALVVWRKQIVAFFKKWGDTILNILGPIGLLIRIVIMLAKVLWSNRGKIGAFFSTIYDGFMKTFGAIERWYKRNRKWLGPLMTIWANTIPGAGIPIMAGKAMLEAGVQKRAAGGPVHPGQPYLVGERGPELYTPAGSGAITPLSGRGGVVIQKIVDRIIIHVHGTQDLAADVQRVVRQALDDLAPVLEAEAIG